MDENRLTIFERKHKKIVRNMEKLTIWKIYSFYNFYNKSQKMHIFLISRNICEMKTLDEKKWEERTLLSIVGNSIFLFSTLRFVAAIALNFVNLNLLSAFRIQMQEKNRTNSFTKKEEKTCGILCILHSNT